MAVAGAGAEARAEIMAKVGAGAEIIYGIWYTFPKDCRPKSGPLVSPDPEYDLRPDLDPDTILQ